MSRSRTLFVFLVCWFVLFLVIPIPRYYYGIDHVTSTTNTMNILASALERVLVRNRENDNFASILTQVKNRWDSIPISERVDAWNNECQLVLAEESSALEYVQVFSFGEDGISKSQGNDIDDLNTWDSQIHREYYRDRERSSFSWKVWRLWRSRLFRTMIFSLIVTMFISIYAKYNMGNRGSAKSPIS